MVPAHVCRRADAEGSEAARGKRRGWSGRPEQADGVSREDEQTATAAAGPRQQPRAGAAEEAATAAATLTDCRAGGRATSENRPPAVV